MQIDKIIAGNLPDEINVVIEIPMNDNPVKYEIDKESGAIFVDRFIQVAMFYPCNYGFIPHTLSGDGDPVDVLVLSKYPVIPGAVMKCRPVGVLMMEDESGVDEKIIAVPIDKVDIIKVSKKDDDLSVAIKFASRQINFIMDENNKIIDGAESQIINLIDNWAFAKNTKLNNSAWQLIATN